jgi:hypothetical protein
MGRLAQSALTCIKHAPWHSAHVVLSPHFISLHPQVLALAELVQLSGVSFSRVPLVQRYA